MVKVVCHGCEAPYQIDERRIPAAGLKMRCPKCGTSLLVPSPRRPGSGAGRRPCGATSGRSATSAPSPDGRVSSVASTCPP
jgi:predicted Zn finger-like uncharacterized protein